MPAAARPTPTPRPPDRRRGGKAIPGTEIVDEPGSPSLTILGEPYDILASDLKP